MHCPVSPFRGLREMDAFGSGSFMAARSRAGKQYGHKGLDFVAVAGDAVLSPCDAKVTRLGMAYMDPECSLRSIHLDRGDGMHIKILYAKPTVIAGQAVRAGEKIAVAQDVAGWHMRHPGDPRTMLNHVHVEIDMKGELVDPLAVIDLPTRAERPPEVA